MGKKLESSFKNMVVVLFCVTLVTSAAVGYVYSLTKGPIAKVKQEIKVQAIKNVIPGGFDNDPDAEKYVINTADGGELEFYPAKLNGKPAGTAVKTYSNSGFSGLVWIMVGFNPDGTIANYAVLEHKETPGLGSQMNTWFTKDGKGSVIGKNPGTTGLKVTKDGGEIDAISSATISSRAFLDAINRASNALQGNDANSGATSQEHK